MLISGSLDLIVDNHKSVSEKYEALSGLLGEEAMNVQDPLNGALEVKAWADTRLTEIFSNLGPLSDEDACVIAKLAALDSSGSFLNRYILYQITS